MKKSLVKKILSIVLCLCLIVPYGAMNSSLTNIFADAKSDLEDAQNALDKAEQERKKTQQEIAALKNKSNSTEAYLEALDEQLAEVDDQLYQLGIQITKLESDIEDTKAELKKAEDESERQYEMMKLRIKFMYEHNDESYLALLLSSGSISEMLNRAEYISKISDYDRKMLEEYQKAVEYVKTVKAQLETELADLEGKKETVELTKASIEVLKDEKDKELAAFNAELARLGKLESQQLEEEARKEAFVKQMEEQVKKEEEANGGGGTAPSGPMLWPTISRRITSRYGATNNRPYPHQGVDIGAVKPGVWGDPIYAAQSGTVTVASYDQGGGYWIWIYHGNGMYTVYMHCSKFYVKVGDKVNKGDTIALMGSTGNSTGAHLHFAVRINGSYVNPGPYLGVKVD